MSSALVNWGYFFPLALSATAASVYALYAGYFWIVDLSLALLSDPFSYLPYFVIFVLGYLYVGSLALYYIHHLVVNFLLPKVNVVRKYKCKWAIVTGASSGIGKALVMKLAEQGANVVCVALDDKVFQKTQEELEQKFPGGRFRFVATNLGDQTFQYYDRVVQACEDIEVNVCYMNAGYLLLGGYAKQPLEKEMANMECNVLSGTRLSHYFLSKMQERRQKGLICFTSSAAAMFPAPAQAMYSAGKSFLTNFAASLAIEAHQYGIDVMCIHPGPMRTNFYNQNAGGVVPQLEAFKFFLAISATPESVADQLISTAGRVTLYDQGTFTFFTRSIIRLVEMNSFIAIMKRGVKFSGDFKKNPNLL
jgi:short-subunit dehydrogenase